MRSIEASFYKTKAWKQVRAAYIQNQNGLCERCKAKGLIIHGVIVHHKIHLDETNINNPDISLSFNNLELLCKTCHNKEHFNNSDAKKRYFFDENGNIFF